MDSSKFNLWRACFAFCHIDKVIADQEKEWLLNKAETLKFTPEEKEILLNDLKSPPDMDKILPLITRPSDRGFLVDQIRVLAKIDGTLSPEEKQKIEEIKSAVLSRINLNELERTVAIDERESYSEDEVYKVHNKNSYFESVHRKLQKLINPGDYKFPDEK